ncbi:hypothetical protein OsJ_17721 [Oryza sativa Japonica Group]|uniref:Uncharacterized protein n=1 Tax=Oryza sativa subsp. japonica TaxID=39947 RepID=Q6ZB03_ORYSJ|nr:hypothetical protein OsJ_17721 [Oryza sativa Japonica Group]BAD01296.1 hypothetical protein [Oryza sativa Japonica Group]BAD05464.1 hypothetical protein [Oryza sativa Japonica Group]
MSSAQSQRLSAQPKLHIADLIASFGIPPNRQAPAVPRNGRGPYDCSIFNFYSRRCPPNRGHGGDLTAVSSRCGCLRGGNTTESTRVYKEVALSQNQRGGTKLIAGWIQCEPKRVAQTKLGVETRPTCSPRRPGGKGAVDLAGAEASRRKAAAVADAAETTADGCGSSRSRDGASAAGCLPPDVGKRRHRGGEGRQDGKRDRAFHIRWAMW